MPMCLLCKIESTSMIWAFKGLQMDLGKEGLAVKK